MDWFKFDIAAYQRATERLSALEDGIYLRLMLAYYQREGPLPADLSAIYRLTHALTRHEKAAVRTVLERFMVTVNGHYRNTRADEEITQYQELIAGKSLAGAQGRAKQLAKQNAGRYKDTEIQPPLPPTSTPVDNSKIPMEIGCAALLESGERCGKLGVHKVHPRSPHWYCREHLDG